MRTVLPMLLLTLSACGGEQLEALQVEQQQLQHDYKDLESNVVALRTELVDLGLMTEAQANAHAEKGDKPGGKTKKHLGNALPKRNLADVLSFTAARTGTAPTLPPLPDFDRTDTECGFTIKLEELQPISDYPLNRDGLGKSSPVILLEDGNALAPHAAPEAFEQACAGAYRHAGFLFLFSPNGSNEIDGHTFSIELASDVPLPRGDDGRPMYWIYPGTTLTIMLDKPWDESWGELKLDISGRVLDQVDGVAKITAGAFATDIVGSKFDVSEVLKDGHPTIEISSPANGPYVLLNILTLGNADNALVVTSQAAFAKGN